MKTITISQQALCSLEAPVFNTSESIEDASHIFNAFDDLLSNVEPDLKQLTSLINTLKLNHQQSHEAMQKLKSQYFNLIDTHCQPMQSADN